MSGQVRSEQAVVAHACHGHRYRGLRRFLCSGRGEGVRGGGGRLHCPIEVGSRRRVYDRSSDRSLIELFLVPASAPRLVKQRPWYGEREMFYLTTHSTHFIYGYMVSDIWLRTILIVRKETRCRHIGYSYRLTARVLLYAPSHRQDNTYHGLCYTSRRALAGTRNSSMGRPWYVLFCLSAYKRNLAAYRK